MPTYRIHRFSPAGKSSVAELVNCADDQEAIAKAKLAVDGLDVELWEDNRFVVRFPHN